MLNSYSNVIYLAGVVIIIFAAVLVIHFIAGSERMERNHKRMPVYCGAVFLVGVGALALLSHSAQSSDVIRGYSPFGPAELSRASQLLSAPISGEFGGEDVSVSGLNLAFNDGRFLNISYDAVEDGGELRPFQVTGSGKLYHGERAGSLALPGDAVPLHVLLSALDQLEAAGWLDKLDLPDGGALVLSTMEPGADGPDGGRYLLRGGELLPAGGEGAGLPALRYAAGDVSGCIYLGGAM